MNAFSGDLAVFDGDHGEIFASGDTVRGTKELVRLTALNFSTCCDSIKALCDEEHTYLSNGNDGYCLVQGTESNYTFIDCVGDFYGDPGSGWDVCGVSAATKDNTLVRKSTVTTGNGGDWTASAGTNEVDCEWLVEPKNTWNFLGSHAMGVASPLPPSLPAVWPAPILMISSRHSEHSCRQAGALICAVNGKGV